MSDSTVVCLSIAGSDSGGGAGIQADLKAFARCGVHGCTAITAITAQNTVAVTGIWPLPTAAIEAQIAAVAADIKLAAVKIGMVGGRDAIAAVRRALDRIDRDLPVVLDPVMVSESGGRLLDRAAETALVCDLVTRATVVTPNVAEARVLAAVGVGAAAAERLEGESLARAVLDVGAQAVVLTGGHRESATDILVQRGRRSVAVAIAGARYPDGAAHGSGCTHASILAARLALGDDLKAAARYARRLAGEAVAGGLRDIGHGAGPVDVLGLSSNTVDL